MKDAFGKTPGLTREGGSIGAVLTMRKHLGAPIVFMGLSLPEHGYHARNENFDWRQASGGIAMFYRYFHEVAALGDTARSAVAARARVAGRKSSPDAAAAPVSRGTAWKILASVVVVVGAVGTLLYFSALPEAAAYKHVDEVMADVARYRGKRIQVHGHVVEGSVLQKTGTLEYRFKLESKAPRNAALIDADYTGLVPDNFKGGAELVATGVISADNRLMIIPDGITAKCPTKYQAQQPAYEGTPAVAKPAQL
jgi:cytochrome c-type biogenesis protein CcmE